MLALTGRDSLTSIKKQEEEDPEMGIYLERDF